MRMRPSLQRFGIPGLLAAGLGFMPGCSRPQADPWPAQLRAATQVRTAALSAADRAEYEEGFANGASMVEKALKVGIRPYRPVLGAERPGMDGAGPLPPGAQLSRIAPHVEVDSSTGLVMVPAADATGGAYARGQAEGFTWALESVGQVLKRPVREPSMPSHWMSWAAHQEGAPIEVGPTQVRLHWSPGLLAWTCKQQGFPAQRTWRAWEGGQAPVWLGAGGGAVWIETREGQALALDLTSGGILAVLQASAHEAPQMNRMEAYAAAVAGELASPAFQAELGRLRKAAASGSIGDLLAVAKKLSGMGEAADREAFSWFLRAAEKGSPEAMLRVGVTLFHGGPVPADKDAAGHWLDRAIQAGHPMAAAVKATLFGG